ncbi:ATP-binding protein [Pararhizobium sp. LjRoot235]|uniref:ATP-binding protein n=1 Tax=Pararhizobium sp. LjRoot235 TaxID=3342291 RepID=UPI003ECD14FA
MGRDFDQALAKTDLLILDDWGHRSSATSSGATSCLEIVEDRYEKRSTIVTSLSSTGTT